MGSWNIATARLTDVSGLFTLFFHTYEGATDIYFHRQVVYLVESNFLL